MAARRRLSPCRLAKDVTADCPGPFRSTDGCIQSAGVRKDRAGCEPVHAPSRLRPAIMLLFVAVLLLGGCGRTSESVYEPRDDTASSSRADDTTTSSSTEATAPSSQSDATTRSSDRGDDDGSAPSRMDRETTSFDERGNESQQGDGASGSDAESNRATDATSEPPFAIALGGPQLGAPLVRGTSVADFGPIAIGSTSPGRGFSIGNRESYDVVVEAVTASHSSFSFTSDTCTGSTLAAQSGSCSLQTVFRPDEEGPRTAEITAELLLTCTSTTHWPCSWEPPPKGVGVVKNFTRTESESGDVQFRWQEPIFGLRGEGVTS